MSPGLRSRGVERQEPALVPDGVEVVGLVTSTDCFEAIAGGLEDPPDERWL